MITSLLIANRGEIACRVIRTARRLGIRTVAVYSEADSKALHVRMADEEIAIGAAPARDSYLVGERIIEAALESGVEAIHPGYGFLSENADFAEAVIGSGLIWVGPAPDSIRAMGLKDAAKKLMAEAGVPVTPGYLGEDQSPERLRAEAQRIGWPILIKAVAGGGGKGMRRVNAAGEFDEMLQSCKREAASSFGDDRVLIEKYVERPRHIEVQVFGDSHGNVVHLFERDCSLQRRHQKVIEEAPAPGMDEETRAEVCEAAVKAAKAVNYVGAGTIEFIADASDGLRSDRIWFMEMNTRLQVEHPVTEEITGQDLVEWQLRVASGETLPMTQDSLEIHGWAIEARLYAEDPTTGFLPSTGRLDHFRIEPEPESRIETGVEEGDQISPYYDPMIAKLVCWGEDRETASDDLRSMCSSVEVWPVRTNAGFLARLIDSEAFRSGAVETGYIARNLDVLTERPEPEGLHDAATLYASWHSRDVPGPLRGLRMNAGRAVTTRLRLDGDERSLALELDPPPGLHDYLRWKSEGEGLVLFEEGEAYLLTPALSRSGVGAAGGADGSIVSPMPGKIISTSVRQGEEVKQGQKLLTLEAMKMEHSLTAPFDGVVTEFEAKEGAQVSEGMLLARIDKVEEA